MRDKRVKITGIVILLLVGFVWQFWPSETEEIKSRFSNSQKHDDGTNLEAGEVAPDNKLLVLDVEGVKKPEGMPDEEWQRLLRVHAIKEAANRNLNFYGKIVDQHGKPIEGVQLDLKILSYQDSFIDYIKTGREQIKNKFIMTTDANGMFSVENQEGISFSIENMRKEGYIAPNRGINYTFIYNNLTSSPNSSMYHSADKSRPVIYELWKKGETEPLILTSAELKLEPENEIKAVYYRMGLKEVPSPEPMPGWDIKLTGKNIHSPDSGRQNDDYWEVTLTAGEGGGLVLTDSPHANLAPETDYESSITIKSTDQKYAYEELVRRAYYRGIDGVQYAAFRLDIIIGSKKRGSRIYVTLAEMRINPNGSRNLEYDPAKRIR